MEEPLEPHTEKPTIEDLEEMLWDTTANSEDEQIVCKTTLTSKNFRNLWSLPRVLLPRAWKWIGR